MSDTGSNYYNVFVDNLLYKVVKTSGKDTLIRFIDNIDQDFHHIMIQKRTEGTCGRTTIHEFILSDKGQLKNDLQPSNKHIEFIGNSLTCGFGVEGKSRDEPYKAETENCNLSYACIIARYFESNYTLIAHSGQGVVRNYGDSVRVSAITMKDRIANTFDMNLDKKWNFKTYKPNLVVINLGSNDFSTEPCPLEEEFIHSYKLIIKQLRTMYGNVPILCISPSIPKRQITRYMENMCKELDDKQIYLYILPKGLYNNTTELGSAWHPNSNGQIKMAISLISYISTITGWPLKANLFY